MLAVVSGPAHHARSIFRDHPPHYRPKLKLSIAGHPGNALQRSCGWPSCSTRPSFAEAYLGATPVVRDCLLRSAPFLASVVRLALIAPSILRCRGTPRPVALGPNPLPKGTTSKGGGRCRGKPHARSHSGPMHIGYHVQEPTPLPTSHAQCPEHASALLHPHFCRHPRRCGLQRPGCDVPVLQQELLSLCYDEQTSALPRASTCLGGKSRSRTPGKYTFSNKNSSPSTMRGGGIAVRVAVPGTGGLIHNQHS